MNQPTSSYPAKGRYCGTIAQNYEHSRLSSPLRRLIWEREFRLIERIMEEQTWRHSTILDSPTGTGRFLPLFERLGHTVIGVDISTDMLKSHRLSAGAGSFLARADCEFLPFPDDAFDYVSSLRFLGHVPPDVRVRILREFKRVSNKGIIVGFPILNSFTKVKFDLGKLHYKLKNGRPWAWWPASSQSLSQELDTAGLKIAHQVKLLGPFSQISFLYLTSDDRSGLPVTTASKQIHLASAST